MEVVNHSERAHSILGASSASRWMNCPPSVALSEGFENKSSSFAAEGTCSHELGEIAIKEGKPCTEYIGQEFEGWTVTEEMADFTQLYVDYVNERALGKELSLEERISLEFIDPRMFGTNDAVVFEEYGELEVIDLKYGKGIEVEAVGNKQLLYYALGAARGGCYTSIRMTIVQPRVPNPIKSWVITPEELEAFADELREAVERVDSNGTDFKVGSHCHFCLAKAVCPAQKAKAQEITRTDFSDFLEPEEVKPLALPSPNRLTKEEIFNILEHSKNIESWLKAVRAYATTAALNGEEIIGHKLIKGNSIRVMTGEQELLIDYQDMYEEELFAPRKLKGLGELDKIIGKDMMSSYTTVQEGSLTLVPESDKRKEVVIEKENYFGDLTEGTTEEETETDWDDLEF